MAPQVGLEPTTLRLTAECSAIELLRNMESGSDLLSRAVSSQVPSALKGLTSVFGMGTGGTPSLLSPEIVSLSGLQVSKYLPKVTSALPLRYSSRFALRILPADPFCCVLPWFHLLLPGPADRTLTTAHCFEFFLSSHGLLKTSTRPISNYHLNALQHLQLSPIYLVVFKGSYS